MRQNENEKIIAHYEKMRRIFLTIGIVGIVLLVIGILGMIYSINF